MGLKLVVLGRQEVDGGAVIQGKVCHDGKDVLAFLAQPNLETVTWLLPEGEAIAGEERLRMALHVVLLAGLASVEAQDPELLANPQVPFPDVQEAWRLGLAHGWATAVGPAEQAAIQYDWLSGLIWPNQRALPVPT